MLDLILNYFSNSGMIAIIVLVVLSFYFILTFTIYMYKFKTLEQLIEDEKKQLDILVSDGDSNRIFST
jgi:ABC-type bacteriocin/lantibiotic exporter with double-glycine peptidase domain